MKCLPYKWDKIILYLASMCFERLSSYVLGCPLFALSDSLTSSTCTSLVTTSFCDEFYLCPVNIVTFDIFKNTLNDNSYLQMTYQFCTTWQYPDQTATIGCYNFCRLLNFHLDFVNLHCGICNRIYQIFGIPI
jgi:hypothetical protein